MKREIVRRVSPRECMRQRGRRKSRRQTITHRVANDAACKDGREQLQDTTSLHASKCTSGLTFKIGTSRVLQSRCSNKTCIRLHPEGVLDDYCPKECQIERNHLRSKHDHACCAQHCVKCFPARTRASAAELVLRNHRLVVSKHNDSHLRL